MISRVLTLSAAMLVALAAALTGAPAPARADAKLDAWIAALWPDAEAAGVSRATFDAAMRGFTPDLKLPDLDLPGRPANDARGQAEFTRAPSEYLDRAYLMRLAATGKELAAKHKATLEKIERELGVDRYSVLAIWGRETAFGNHKLPHDAINVVATQAYLGRRKDMFRLELIAALRMLDSGIPRAKMRASWAGAMGLTQFMPSEFFTHAHDLDGDGKADIWNSVPDALASAASQLKGKGWVAGQTWGYEVILTPQADCGHEGPTQGRTIADWAKLGLKRANGKAWTPEQLALEAYMMSPAGGYGPSFLVLENYKVIRRYNMSDLYAVFVGHLADRIAGGGDFVTPWGGTAPQKTANIVEIQERLGPLGYEVEKVDGKVGSNTRKVIGLYERANNLKVDCWPSDAVLNHIRKGGVRESRR
ncbi:MAG: lytic murein transglycosylase [Hyphomicrobium sp.]|jgi:lytic murein transglycosylase|uniref:lytic murein transglycosylase n=1 Tax=Hyphomicrobium sp. TaxID=82 RepID=UPI0025B84177|nr:lytic murein transglycosylase [Hyphomicrobium sp.]MBX9862139.1 lytic murein transglycosylase [Hyphomicrobium sp.]